MKADFCELAVALIYNIPEPYNVDSVPSDDLVSIISYNNDDFDMDFKITESSEGDASRFELSIWNTRRGGVFTTGSYISYEFNWESKPDKTSGLQYGVIDDIKVVEGSDIKFTVQGYVSDQYAMKMLKLSEENTVIRNLNDFYGLCGPLGISQVESQIPNFTIDTPFSKPIGTFDKTILETALEIVEIVREQTGVNVGWRLHNKTEFILRDKDTDFLGSDLDVPQIFSDDLFISKSATEAITVTKNKITKYIECQGIPDLHKEQIIKLDEILYIVDEIEHSITTNDGYNMKLFIHTFEEVQNG